MPAEQRDGAGEAQPHAQAAAVPGSAFCIPETVAETVRIAERCLCGSAGTGAARNPCAHYTQLEGTRETADTEARRHRDGRW